LSPPPLFFTIRSHQGTKEVTRFTTRKSAIKPRINRQLQHKPIHLPKTIESREKKFQQKKEENGTIFAQILATSKTLLYLCTLKLYTS